MSNIYKVNLTWTSPLIEYAPPGAWLSAIAGQNDSTASFRFYGNGFKWFGAANASTYTIQLDEQPISAQPRKYPRVEEGPTGLYCNETIPWECMVLAEFYNLSAGVEHTVQLSTTFGRNATGHKVNLLAVQTLYDTHSASRNVVQTNQVKMEDSRLVYAGDWKNITYDPQVYRVSTTPGSTISFQFKGYSIQLWGTTDISQSTFTVSLDGRSHNVSLPSSGDSDPNCLFWYAAGLNETLQHTVVVTNTGSNGLIIKGLSFSQLIDADNPGGSEDTGQSHQGLPPGAIAGIVAGAVALIFVVATAYFLHTRLKKHRQVKVVGTGHENANTGSTTSTLLSLRPLLGVNRSQSRSQISPWSETPGSRADLRIPPSPDQASPIVPSPLTSSSLSAKQALLGVPSSSSGRSPTEPTERRPSVQPPNEPPSPSRRRPSGRIQDDNSAGVFTASAQHKPPLYPQADENRSASPTSPLSTISGVTGSSHFQPLGTVDHQHSEDHGSLSHHGHEASAAEPSGVGLERPATPPPAYEPQAEASREGERRALRRGISKAIEERFRVVRNE